MDTLILKVDPVNPDEKILCKAAEILKNGGLVAFPTETVYGLGANGLDGEACKKIYAAKGRPSDNPLILHIWDKSCVYDLADEIPPAGKTVMDRFWPGPVTLVFRKKDVVPDVVSGGLNTVAVRFPENAVARRLLELTALPVAAPSANSSGKPSPTRASHVEFDLSGKIDAIIDGGPCEFGLESTILDVTGDIPLLLRPGAVTLEELQDVLGQVDVDLAVFDGNAQVPKAPGMKYTHYSPLAEVFLVEGENSEDVCRKINGLLERDAEEGVKSGVLTFAEMTGLFNCEYVLSAGSREDLKEIGANLFKMLRKFDFLNVERVYCETVPSEGEGFAIMNRLAKAAGFKRI